VLPESMMIGGEGPSWAAAQVGGVRRQGGLGVPLTYSVGSVFTWLVGLGELRARLAARCLLWGGAL
jgi:hypothetical protein